MQTKVAENPPTKFCPPHRWGLLWSSDVCQLGCRRALLGIVFLKGEPRIPATSLLAPNFGSKRAKILVKIVDLYFVPLEVQLGKRRHSGIWVTVNWFAIKVTDRCATFI